MSDIVRDAIARINKKYGGGTMMLLNDSYKADIDVIPSGSLGLDAAMGIGGYPRGRIVEIAGWESSGKSTLMLHATAECHKLGLPVAYIDSEHAFDFDYARNIVGDAIESELFYLSQPDYAEQALDIIGDLVATSVFGLIIVDSVAALTPKREIDGEAGDAHMGLLARLMAQACRRLIVPIHKNNTCVIFVNQYRHGMGGGGFGPQKVTTGGNSLKFATSIRLDIARTGTKKDGTESLSNKTKVTVKKNKLAPPYKVAEFDILFGAGIDKDSEIVELALKAKVIKRAGSWYKTLEGESLGQGIASVVEKINSDPEYRAFILKGIGEYSEQGETD